MADYSKNEKYISIIKTGRELFWKYGIKRVSVEEICKEAQVSKMTFYKYFGNKIELAKQILKQLVEKPLIEYKELIERDCPFVEKVNKMLEMKRKGSEGVSQEFINDIYNNPEFGLTEYMSEYGEKSFQLTVQFMKQSQLKGDIRKDMKIEFVMYFLNKMLEMTTDKNLISIYEHPSDLIMEVTEFFFYGIGAKK